MLLLLLLCMPRSKLSKRYLSLAPHTQILGLTNFQTFLYEVVLSTSKQIYVRNDSYKRCLPLELN